MKEKIYSDTMILGSGHSMLVSHVPGIKLEPGIISDKFYEVSKKDQESVDKFGLFGSNSNYNTYYPDVKPEQRRGEYRQQSRARSSPSASGRLR